MAPKAQPPLFSFISDQYLALFLPVIVYWVYSLLFHWISQQGYPWLEKYRIHDKEEDTRNKVALPEVIKAVIVQQVLQTALGVAAVLADDSQYIYDDELSLSNYQLRIQSALSLLQLQGFTPKFAVESLAYIYYFFIEPLIRFSIAMIILDTWQYAFHRLFHTIPYLYKHFHSRHHRLIVTYPFGALYNHPFEGFMMDSVGASLSFLASGMGNRGALAFFSFSTLKTLDDHCGYNLPFNPLQMIFSNNSDYHDIHHQPFGFKKNFSQPFGTFWDHILGTHMSREEANEIIRKKEERRKLRSSFTIDSTTGSSKVMDKMISPTTNNNTEICSSGNNSGNESREDSEDQKDKLLAFQNGIHQQINTRRQLSARARLDNGIITGKGQGKAL